MNKNYLLIAVGAIPIVALLVLLVLPSPARSKSEPADASRAHLAETAVAAIQRADLADAERLVGPNAAEPVARDAMGADERDRLLDALAAENRRNPTRQGLKLYGSILADGVRRDVPCRAFATHVRRLRQQALTLGEKDDLFKDVALELFELKSIVDYDPSVRADVIDYFLLFGDHPREEAVSRANLARALEHVQFALAENRRAPPEDAERRFHPWRALARIAGQSQQPEALRLCKHFLGLLATEAPDDVTAFNAWYREATGLRTEPDWIGPADAAEYFRFEPRVALQLRNWLLGLVRYYAPGRGLDRGSTLLARAVAINSHDPFLEARVRLDLGQSLRIEANRRAALLRDESKPFDPNSLRQLYDVGFGAAQLGDRDELAEVLKRISGNAGNEAVQTVGRLLRVADHLLAGQTDATAEIPPLLSARNEFLSPIDRDAWQSVAVSGNFPEADLGLVLFTSGKLWDELGEVTWLRRATDRLRREIASRRDDVYLRYLQALLDYREGRLVGLQDRLLSLLDEEPTRGLARAEIAGLLEAVDTRMEELEAITRLRARARDDLVPQVLAMVPDSSAYTRIARCLDWQLRADVGGHAFLASAAGREQLAALALAFGTESGFEFELEEIWLAMKDDLLRLARHYRGLDQLDEALSTLELAKSLVRDLPAYRLEEAHILSRRAARLNAANEDAYSAAWQAAGVAFSDSARTDLGDREYRFEAGEAFLKAGQLDLAKVEFEEYDEDRKRGAAGEDRYWRKRIFLARIYRLTGDAKRGFELAKGALIAQGSFAYRYELLLERGLCEEQLGDDAAARASFDEICGNLDPTSDLYVSALARKAAMAQRAARVRLADTKITDAERRSVQESVLPLWEELAVRLRSSGDDPRLAEALFVAGETRIEIGDFERARAHLVELSAASKRANARELDEASRRRWYHYSELGAFALADCQWSAALVPSAADYYSKAVSAYPDSALAVYAYYQLGDCALREGNKTEAVRVFRMGERRATELPAEVAQKLPPGQNRDFWRSQFTHKIAELTGVPGVTPGVTPGATP
ncbi:MAG: tetratricopeptide repeat protein [Planctomycetota bacterium]